MQIVNNITTLVTNPQNGLKVEHESGHNSVSLDFKFFSQNLFGLPEREDTLWLINTNE